MIRFLLIVAILYFVIPPLLRLAGLVLAFFLRRAVLNATGPQGAAYTAPKQVATQASLVECPTCKLNLPMLEALPKSTKEGTVYFCSKECQKSYSSSH